MKKFYNYIVLMLLLAIGIFYGCSKSADMQTPPSGGMYTANAVSEESENIFYISLFANGERIGDGNYVQLNPGLEHYIEFIIEGIETDYVTFQSEQQESVYLKQLYVVSMLIQKGAYQGATKMIENVLLKFAKNIDEPLNAFVELELAITLQILEDPTAGYYFDETITWEYLANLSPGSFPIACPYLCISLTPPPSGEPWSCPCPNRIYSCYTCCAIDPECLYNVKYGLCDKY